MIGYIMTRLLSSYRSVSIPKPAKTRRNKSLYDRSLVGVVHEAKRHRSLMKRPTSGASRIFQEAFNLPLIIPLTLDLRDSELEQDRDDSVLAFVSFLSSMICDSTNPNVDGVSPDRFGDWLHNDTPSLRLVASPCHRRSVPCQSWR